MERRSTRGASEALSYEDPGLSAGQRIKLRRTEMGLSLPGLAHRMKLVGARYRGVAGRSALIPMISKWETDKITPNEYNRRILAMALGVQVSDLGMTEDPYYKLVPSDGSHARSRRSA